MILIEIVELIDEQTKEQRIQAGAEAQRRVRDDLRGRFGKEMSKTKIARVGSKMFDIETDLFNDRQKVEVKSMTKGKPYFAFFDTYVGKGMASPILDDITKRVTNGQFHLFSDAVDSTPDSGFPCEIEKNLPKSGRVPPLLKNITDQTTLLHVRELLLHDLMYKGINYLALFNRSNDTVTYYHLQGENYLKAPPLPPFRKIYFDTYGAPNYCAMRVVVRIAL